MKYAVGTAISFTPDTSWTAIVQTKEGTQTGVPVVGWAVVAQHVEDGEVETDIEPVLLDEGCGTVYSRYLQDRKGLDLKIWLMPVTDR